MKENQNKKTVVRVTEGKPNETADVLQDNTQTKFDKIKKPLIFGLMGIVFVGCMYLIFKPSEDKNKNENIGLNDVVPQASEAGLQSDKQKAYEEEILEQKNQEKKNALTSLSDYWNTDEKEEPNESSPDEGEEVNDNNAGYQRNNNPALNSYRNAQNTLGEFYQKDNYETQQLRKQMEELKEQLAEKEVIAPDPVKTQLQLMEKSYEMASKFLPANTQTSAPNGTEKERISASTSGTQKEYFVAFSPVRKSPVSTLYRENTDSVFISSLSGNRNRGFHSTGSSEQVSQPKNSIKASVLETQTIIGETAVQLRLLETAQTPRHTIPKGTVLTANTKFQGGRLQLKVTSIELEGNIITVNINIYDLDGQQGLNVPYSSEMNALTEMAGNMSQTSGTNLMLTNSAGQQIASDLSRGVVQGISGYFSKKLKIEKVTLKAGHQLLLVSKK
ncbi:conjugative transposon protein TraM [Flavobacterium sp. TAB 87]|uniref:conjugative transposon protein TraM n=1 Tax=Flavobacterium sp. TAB 87 TaxID=1729581 RepID=UPI00076C09D1|nr:conjugative transposon protein TraM [Flavobacterium sp. TAB 87]KVV15050.1 hypothetical protein AP058_01608 [Flavobacterium sp. TAB 87]